MIRKIQETINQKKAEVETWLDEKRKDADLPFYSSFDLRDDGTKAAIVDANLFPAGWNNLGHIAREKAAKALAPYAKKHKDILILPEEHTRNPFYICNLYHLRSILEKAGFRVVVGCIREDLEDCEEILEDSDGHTVHLEKITRDGDKLTTKTFIDGAILLNNDFSIKPPDMLNGLEQEIIPPLELGWHRRKKIEHFSHVKKLVEEFCDMLGIDPWLLRAKHKSVDGIDFHDPGSIEKISSAVDEIISEIKAKHDEHGIEEDPYVFVKDNSGTYGLGIVSVKSGDDIRNLNSPQRRKMLKGKQKAKISSVIIQEGIRTHHKIDCNPAEPVLYSAGGKIVGGFMRVHPEKDKEESLNRPGMRFDMLLENRITRPLIDHFSDDSELSIYGIMADIANIAIAREHQHI